MKFVRNVLDWVQGLLFEPTQMMKLGLICLLAESFINTLIVEKVRYTEIDWKAYMDEVEGFLNGTYDYVKLKGGTGPLVYPAGFVYFFSGLYYITGHGSDIRLAQYIFGFFYLVTYGLVVKILKKTEAVPPFVLLFFTFASYRVHSIFALRLFNDPVAMMFLYLSVLLFLEKKWYIGCAVFSFAVSIKMNIMLFSPGLFYILLVETGFLNTAICISLCAAIQLVLGLPFLLENPYGYIKMSFDLGRQFFFKWTVNYRFLPEPIFSWPLFHIGLLLLHVLLLIALCALRWKKLPKPLSPKSTLLILFSSNFIGVACARSLHYQFYVWYYHTLPPLFFSTRLPVPVVMLMLGCVEMCWNVFPSTVLSSAVLQSCHVIGILALLGPTRSEKRKTG